MMLGALTRNCSAYAKPSRVILPLVVLAASISQFSFFYNVFPDLMLSLSSHPSNSLLSALKFDRDITCLPRTYSRLSRLLPPHADCMRAGWGVTAWPQEECRFLRAEMEAVIGRTANLFILFICWCSGMEFRWMFWVGFLPST